MALGRQDCPDCGDECKIAVDLDSAPYAQLPDRVMALADMTCEVICLGCDRSRQAVIQDLEIDLDSGRIEVGELLYDD